MRATYYPSDTIDLPRLGLGPLSRRCAEESERFFRRQPHDPCYCTEMLRRAIVNRDSRAWTSVYTQYRPLVAGWVRRHTDVAATGEDVDFFVNLAFERFWRSLTPERYALSPDLKSLLRYLAMCVHSAIVDYMRSRELTDRVASAPSDLEEFDLELIDPTMDVEGDTLDAVERAEIWQHIRSRLRDDKEELVIYYSYVVGLKPREILAHLPGTFETVDEVHSIKEKALLRLRRDTSLKQHIGKSLLAASM